MTPSKCILLVLALLLSIGTTWASICSTTNLLMIDSHCLTPAADECLANDDTQIQCLTCKPGFFVTGAGTCTACSTCGNTEYQVTACSATANTVCQACYGRTTNCTSGGAVTAGTCVLGESAIQCDTDKCATNYVLAAAGPDTGTCNQCAEFEYYSPTINGVGGCTNCTLATAGCTTALTTEQWCIGDKVACDADEGTLPQAGCMSGYAIQYDGTCMQCTMKPPGCMTLQANGCNANTTDLNKSSPTDTAYYAYGICTSCADGYVLDAVHGVCYPCEAGKSLAKDGSDIGLCVVCTNAPPNCDTALPTYTAVPVRRKLLEEISSLPWYDCTSPTFSSASPTYKRCIVCNEGYYVTASGLCEVCTSAEDDDLCAAITCPAGSYFNVATASCETCTTCTGGAAITTECQSGGDYFTNSVCSICTGKPDNCLTAEADTCVLNTTTRKCASCASPYELQTNSVNAGLCWECPDGEALNSSGICESCTEVPDDCDLTTATYPGAGAACISPTFPTTKVCLECDAGFYLKNGSCVECSTCSEGQYVSSQCSATADTMCHACKSSCSSGYYMSGTCSGSGSTDTIECKICRNDDCRDGEYISKYCDGTSTADQFGCAKCKTSCPIGQYLDQKCSGSTYADDNECKPIVCNAGFFLKNGSCIKCSSCSAGQYVSSQCSATTDTVCKACKTSCSSGYYMSGTCSGSESTDTIECKVCRNDDCEAGSYISKYCTGKTTRDQFGCTKCKTSCPIGQYLDQKCSGSTYTDDNECKPTVCNAGFFLKNGSCIKCSSCSAGQYVSSQCSATTDTVCKACKTSCSSGYYMSGTCSGSESTDTIKCKVCRNDDCEAGSYISKYCTGKTTRDQFGCTKCKTSCPIGQYLEGQCSGVTYADTIKCKACTAQKLCASGKSSNTCVTGKNVLKCNKCKATAKLDKNGLCERYPEYIVVDKPVPVPVPVPVPAVRTTCSGVMDFRQCTIPGKKAKRKSACYNEKCTLVSLLGGKQRCNPKNKCGKGVVCYRKSDCLSQVCTQGACAPSDYGKKCMRTSDCQTTLKCKKGTCLN